WRPQPSWPEFSSSMHLIDWGGKLYGQFPSGGPALTALGTLLGAEWLIGPLAGAISVLCFARLMRRVAPSPGVALGASLLFGFAPFAVFMSGSRMSHVTVLTCVAGAALALASGMASETPRPRLAFFAGLGFGMAATIRPVDALAFALPAGLWYLLRAARQRERWVDVLAAGSGIAIPLALLMYVNYRTTGAPLRFGYDVMWGDAKFFGFGAMPGGDTHTPIKGLELINIYLLRLEVYLFETPIPSLIPALAALWMVERTTAFERYLNLSAALFLALYAAYWHDGFYLGPRLVFPLLPVLAFWTARAFPLARERWGGRLGWRAIVWGGLAAVVLALAFSIPTRARQYRGGLLTMRWDPDSAATAAGVRGALVLVRESWGAQLLPRLWARGVSRSTAEAIYGAVDRCELETDLTWAEQTGASTAALLDRIRPALADQARLERDPTSADPTARYLPGRPYSGLCELRRREEGEGFTLFPPLLLSRGDNIFLRDLHARDTVLFQALPHAPVYLLKPADAREGLPPMFFRVRRDSAYAAWAAEARQASSGNARQ
ncbi:MAG TPA: hypothetical protein VMJ30_11070, partial [Gemmatimonadales bacterium]|nr:hypothetical protein [Gemmatimonadales bacterium]